MSAKLKMRALPFPPPGHGPTSCPIQHCSWVGFPSLPQQGLSWGEFCLVKPLGRNLSAPVYKLMRLTSANQIFYHGLLNVAMGLPSLSSLEFARSWLYFSTSDSEAGGQLGAHSASLETRKVCWHLGMGYTGQFPVCGTLPAMLSRISE